MTNKPIFTTIEGAWTYNDAIALISALKNIGADAGITVGGVWVTFDLQEHGPAVVETVKRHDGRFCHQTHSAAIALENAERQIHQQQVEELERLWRSR